MPPIHRFNSRYIITISFISALGGYLFGFDFAVISGALPFLQQQFGLDAYWEGFATGSLALGQYVTKIIHFENILFTHYFCRLAKPHPFTIYNGAGKFK